MANRQIGEAEYEDCFCCDCADSKLKCRMQDLDTKSLRPQYHSTHVLLQFVIAKKDRTDQSRGGGMEVRDS